MGGQTIRHDHPRRRSVQRRTAAASPCRRGHHSCRCLLQSQPRNHPGHRRAGLAAICRRPRRSTTCVHPRRDPPAVRPRHGHRHHAVRGKSSSWADRGPQHPWRRSVGGLWCRVNRRMVWRPPRRHSGRCRAEDADGLHVAFDGPDVSYLANLRRTTAVRSTSSKPEAPPKCCLPGA